MKNKTPIEEYFNEIDKCFYDYKTFEEQDKMLINAKESEKLLLEKFYNAGILRTLSSNEFDKNRTFNSFYESLFGSSLK